MAAGGLEGGGAQAQAVAAPASAAPGGARLPRAAAADGAAQGGDDRRGSRGPAHEAAAAPAGHGGGPVEHAVALDGHLQAVRVGQFVPAAAGAERAQHREVPLAHREQGSAAALRRHQRPRRFSRRRPPPPERGARGDAALRRSRRPCHANLHGEAGRVGQLCGGDAHDRAGLRGRLRPRGGGSAAQSGPFAHRHQEHDPGGDDGVQRRYPT